MTNPTDETTDQELENALAIIAEREQREGVAAAQAKLDKGIEPGKAFRIKRKYNRIGITVAVTKVISYNRATGFIIIMGERAKWASDIGIYWGAEKVYTAKLDEMTMTDSHRGHDLA